MSEPNKWTVVMAGIVALISVLALHQAARAPAPGFDSLGSAAVPYFIAICLIILTGLMLLEEFTSRSDDLPLSAPEPAQPSQGQAEASRRSWPIEVRTGTGFGLFIIYALTLNLTPVPYWAATFVFAYSCSRILEGGSGRFQRTSLIVAAVLAVSIEVIFTRFLLIDLP